MPISNPSIQAIEVETKNYGRFAVSVYPTEDEKYAIGKDTNDGIFAGYISVRQLLKSSQLQQELKNSKLDLEQTSVFYGNTMLQNLPNGYVFYDEVRSYYMVPHDIIMKPDGYGTTTELIEKYSVPLKGMTLYSVNDFLAPYGYNFLENEFIEMQ